MLKIDIIAKSNACNQTLMLVISELDFTLAWFLQRGSQFNDSLKDFT